MKWLDNLEQDIARAVEDMERKERFRKAERYREKQTKARKVKNGKQKK